MLFRSSCVDGLSWRRLMVVLAALAVFASALRPAAAQSGGTWEFGPSDTYFDSTVNISGPLSRDYPPITVRTAGSMQSSPPTDSQGTSYAIHKPLVASDGTAAGYAKSVGTLRMEGYWIPHYDNPNAPVPEKVTVRFHAEAFAALETTWTRPLTVDSGAVDNGFGDAAVYTYYPPNNSVSTNGYRWQSYGKHLRTFDVTGATEETTESGRKRWKVQLSLSLTSSASIGANGSGFIARKGSMSTLTAFAGGLAVEPDNREPLLYVFPFSPNTVIVDKIDNKELKAYAKVGWFDDGVAEHPLYPFYEAASDFSFYGKRDADSILLKEHKWTASPEVFIPQTPIPNRYAPSVSYLLEEQQVAPPTVNKNFHWNLGTSADDLPKSSVVTVKAKDPSDNAQMSATAKINWKWAFEGGGGGSEDDDTITKLPGGTVGIEVPGPYGGTPTVVQKPIQDVQVGEYLDMSGELRRRITSKTTNADGSITLTYEQDPDDNPTDPFYDTNQQILRLQDAKTDAIRKGATYVGYGLQAYVELAGMTVGAPLYNLGPQALMAAGSKAVSLISTAQKARSVASKLNQVLGGAQSVLVKLRTKLGTLASGTDEFAQVSRQINEMEDTARAARAGIDEAEDVANRSQYLAEEVDEAVKINQAAQAAKTRGEAALDANAVIGALERAEIDAVDAALAGRTPVLSIRAAREFLRKGDPAALREFLSSRGGRLGPAATGEAVANLQQQAKVMGRALRWSDANVADSAMQEGLVLLTRDEKFFRFLQAAKIPVEKY